MPSWTPKAAVGTCLLVLSLLAGATGCSREPASKPEGAPAPVLSYDDQILRERRNKDAAFRGEVSSPLPVEDRVRFDGLAYYPPNAALRFQSRLQRYPAPKSLRLGTNTGEVRVALRYGWFEFEVEGKGCKLQAYRMEDGQPGAPPSLFVPFRDSTSGEETYAAGRYIDLKENTTGIYDLDFNRAYNPSCAYGAGFSCPMPPRENWLDVPIRAGEKKYPLERPH